MIGVEEVAVCNFDGPGWLWAHGWLDKRKFKGACLSKAPYLELLDDVQEVKQGVFRGTVHHGWVITVAGDTSGCGWDMTIYFTDDEPIVNEGTWDGADRYDEDQDEYLPAEVVDGPHKATWLNLDG